MVTFLVLDAIERLPVTQPAVAVRLHRSTPPALLEKCAQVLRQGGGAPILYNDDVIIPGLVAAGVTLEDARDYGVVGCLEPNAQGKSFGSTFAVQLSGIKCLELGLSNGVDNIWGQQRGIDTGDPSSFSCFEDV